MMKRAIRQVKYNIETDTGDQIYLRYQWTICIINEPIEIKRIKERMLEVIAPSAELRELATNCIKGSGGLHYEAFCIQSEKGNLTSEEKRRVYDNLLAFKKDRDLTSKKNDVWFDEIYIPWITK